jgi:hypothetical protein
MQIDSLINSIPFIGKENNGKKTSTKECQLKRELQSPAADDSSCSENIATSSRNPIEQLKDNNPRRLCILPIPIPFPVPIPLTSDFILMNYGRQ